MKLSDKTLTVLNNYSKINSNIVISPGNEIRTRNEDKTIGSRFLCEENFPKEVAIFSLPEFLNVIRMFQDPEFDFQDKYVQISDKLGKQRFTYANKNALVYADKVPPTLKYNYEFEISKELLSRLLKATSTNSFDYVALNSNGGRLSVIAGELNKDTRDFEASSNLYTIEIDEVNPTEDFNIVLNTNDLQMIVDDYKVGIYFTDSAKIIHFYNESLEYWVNIQKFSKFGNS